MRKRWLIGIFLLLVGCAVVALTSPATLLVSLGFLRGEAFFGGKPTNYWVRAVKQETFLGQLPPQSDVGKTLREGRAAAVPVLCEMAEDPNGNVRSEALIALCLMGPDARGAARTLTASIEKEKNSTLFLLASDALARVDPAAAAEALSAILRDKEESSRRAWALGALHKIAPEGKEALPILNEMFHDQDEDTRLRVQAILVLYHMNQPAEPLALALCTIADADKGIAGVQAIEALGDMGPAAKSAGPALLKLLQRPNLAVSGNRWGAPHQAAIIRTLGKIGPEAPGSVPALIAIFKSNKYGLHGGAALALAQIGPPAREAFPMLLQALAASEAREVVRWTSMTLVAAQPPAPAAILSLFQIPTSLRRDEQTVKAIREAVVRVDPDAAARAGVH